MRSLGLSSLVGCLLWFLVAPALSVTGEGVYDQLIATAASGHGLEPALVKAVIKCESRFDPGAQSPKGAQGLMQLMPGTQAMLGVSNAFDPQHNVQAGTRYLAMLKQTFNGDLQLALAAYNAGPQTVVEAGYTIPAITETQQYVRCVWTAYERYRQPGAASLLPGLRLPAPALSTIVARQSLVVSPLRLSSQVARVGERLTVQLEAVNTGPRVGHGVLMVNYPGHLVSLMALHATGQETLAQLPFSNAASAAPGAAAATTYQLLWSHWRVWAPGERRTAMIALVPRLAQDITFHVSLVLDTASESAKSPAAPPIPQRWSTVVRIPFQSAAWAETPRYRTPYVPVLATKEKPVQKKKR